MPKRISPRRRNRNAKCNIFLTDIKYNSRCIDLDLPFSLCCDSCCSILEAESGLLKKSSHKSKRYRDLSERRRCQQPWSSEHNKPYKPTTTIQKFIRVRNYLKVHSDIEINNSYINDLTKKSKQQDTNITSQCNTEGIISGSSPVPHEVITTILPDTNITSQCNTEGIISGSSPVPHEVITTNLPTTSPAQTITTPSSTPSTHDNPPICANCQLAATLNDSSTIRPSNPPSAHSPEYSNVNEPTRLVESSLFRNCNASMNADE